MPANRVTSPTPAAILACLALSLAATNLSCQTNQPDSQQMQQRFDQSRNHAQRDIQTQQRRLGTGQSALQKGQ